MTDKYRIIGKSSADNGEPIYLLELEIQRSILISRGDMQSLFSALSEGNGDGGWTEIINLVQSGFYDDVNPAGAPLVQSPWLSVNFSNENLNSLLSALQSQSEDLAVHGSGSPDSGGITLTINISGRQYSRTVHSSAEARNYANTLTELRNVAIQAGWKTKAIEKIAVILDWALRAAGVYELAEKAWEKIQEKITAEQNARAFEKELHDHINRERNSGVDRAHEMDMADKISRTG